MSDHPPFTFRALGPADKAAMLAISARIWDGGDYLPSCIDAWAADGSMYGCFAGDRLVGFGRRTFVAPGHAWLEGLRKDPDSGVKGVGRALCIHALRSLRDARAAGADLRSIRFTTYFGNAASISLNEKVGFRRVAVMSQKCKGYGEPDPDDDEPPSSRITPTEMAGYAAVPAASPDACLARMRSAGWFEPFACWSWRAYALDDALAVLGDSGAFYEAKSADGRIAGSMLFTLDRTKGQASIVALEADDDRSAAALVEAAERECFGAGYDYIEVIAPTSRPILDRLAACGFRSWEQEDDFLVYELPLERLDALPED